MNPRWRSDARSTAGGGRWEEGGGRREEGGRGRVNDKTKRAPCCSGAGGDGRSASRLRSRAATKGPHHVVFGFGISPL